MLTELKLSNFRIFDNEVTVRFRPITILIGRNSSGKSSIVKFLLMLQQSAAPGQSQFLSPEGTRVSLGTFNALKNALTEKKDLTFDLIVSDAATEVDPFITQQSKSSEIAEDSALWYRLQANVRYSRRASRGRANFSLVNTSTGDQILTFDVRRLADSSLWDYPRQSVEVRSSSLPPSDEEASVNRAELFARLKRMREVWGRRFAEVSVIDKIRYQVNSIRHLLPVRVESQRVILASVPPVDDVGQGGEYALPHLQQLISESGERYKFIRPHLENIAGIESVRFRTSLGYVSQALARNKTTGADVLIADYGFGVGQCLPILIQGAIMSPQTTLMVEQPEAQLHPSAQLEMGSFFADLWTQRQVASIIETHSDNILLRLRRLIAKGDLSNEDVSVAFFTFDEENPHMPVIKNLDIKEDGSMEAGLPMEFFGADIIEGLQLGARI